MSEQNRAPTSKLLELIRTGKIPQDEEIAKDEVNQTEASKLTASNAKLGKRTKKPQKERDISPTTENRLTKQENISISGGYYKVPNIVDDLIVGTLSITEEIVYRHMIWLSWGWNRNWCRVGTHYFQQKSSLTSRKAIRDAINQLLEKRLIVCHTVNGKIDRNQEGTVYIVPLPEGNGILRDSILPNDPNEYIFKDNLKDTLST